MTDRIMHHLGQVFRLRFCMVVPFVDAEKVGFGSFSDFEQRSHEVRFALWTGHRRRSTLRCWRNDIPAPVAQFVAHILLQASSRRRRHPKRNRLFKHQAEVEVAPLGSAMLFRARTMTGRTLATSEFSISRWRHSPSLQEVPVEVGQIEITHLVTNT